MENMPAAQLMKIKQTTFYALKIIRTIYLNNGKVMTSTSIAEKEKISSGVVLKVLRKLKDAGILCVYQGRGEICGGFKLIQTIDEITLLDIVDIMEGVDICRHLTECEKKEIKLLDECNEVNEHLKEEFSKYTMRELFDL